ncbi:MAG: epoxyalkane--coenzyme M transferase [Dehalococcoidia bacterium]|nr:epoxyalkane--coenzyme M transferase [Dehalococcoidia bacterium]
MKRSTKRILTTHVGRIQRPEDITEAMEADPNGGVPVDAKFNARLKGSVAEVVQQQADAGVDVVNDGEFGHISWGGYQRSRLSGFENKPAQGGQGAGGLQQRKDRALFAGYYGEQAKTGVTYYRNPGRVGPAGTQWVCTSPIKYTGQAALQRDLDNMKAALAGAKVEEGFMNVTAPSGGGQQQNAYYSSDEAFAFAMGDALKEESQAIVRAGLILHVDDPLIVANWDQLNMHGDLNKYLKRVEMMIEVANHAIAGIPEDKVRLHICYGSWLGPHVTDIAFKEVAPLFSKLRVQAYVIEAANTRHEHEWKIWKDLKLTEGRILVPGVVTHHTNTVEHPELVADRIKQYASVVGRENVIAGTDCGLGYRVHPEIQWAKLKTLSEGAALASKELWRRS